MVKVEKEEKASEKSQLNEIKVAEPDQTSKASPNQLSEDSLEEVESRESLSTSTKKSEMFSKDSSETS